MTKRSALECAILQMDDDIAALETAREYLVRQRPKPAAARKPAPKPDAPRSAGPTLRVEAS